jgi:hypothetical protein
MKANRLAIVGGIIGLASTILPWWTFSLSDSTTSIDATAYLYKISSFGASSPVVWFCWATLIFILFGSIISLAGGALTKSKLLTIGVIFEFLGILMFPLGLLMNFTSVTGNMDPIPVGLFTFGSHSGVNYSSYLSFGFWSAIVSAAVMLISIKIKSKMPTAQQSSINNFYKTIGSNSPSQTQAIIQCKRCGCDNPSNCEFCGKCGARLNEEETKIY